jgi:hypothetical protein
MKKILKGYILVMVLVLFNISLSGDEPEKDDYRDSKDVKFYLELNQIMGINLGVHYSFTERFALKGAFGVAPFHWTSMSYSLLGSYLLNPAGKKWLFFVEGGMPIGYFDEFEGRYIDKDPYIDDPYHGFIVGGGILITRAVGLHRIGLRIGAGPWWEEQEHSGWKGPRIMPVVSLAWYF